MSDVGDTAGVSADLHSSTASSIYSTMQAGREWRSGGGGSGPAYKREPFPSVSRAQRASVIIIGRRSSCPNK